MYGTTYPLRVVGPHTSFRGRPVLGYCPQKIVLNDGRTVAYRETSAGLLSGGAQQKLNLVLALMDEPYQGFDSVLIISHIAHETTRFARIFRFRGRTLTGSAGELSGGQRQAITAEATT